MGTKNTQKALISLFILIIGTNIVLAQSAVPHSNYGVWNRGGDPSFNPNQANYDYLVGVTKGPMWAEIQPNNSTSFDWSEMQEAIDLAYDNNQLVALKINVGPQSPDWIYNEGVTKVMTTGHRFETFPYYLEQEYIDFYYAMIDEFAAFIFSQPQDKQDLLSFIFPQNGATGDEVPYKGDLTSESQQYDISDAEWETFRINSWNHWKNAFRDGQPRPIPFLFNDLDINSVEWNWIINNIGNDFGIKNSNGFVRGHHLTKEKSWNETNTQFLVDPQGLELFNRAEMDQTWTKPMYNLNTELGFYWGAIGGLSTGLSIWDVTTSALEFAGTNNSVQETFRFFNKYAGQIDPAVSKKAFIALHEGLNSEDTDKFPEDIYGEANRDNINRYQAICDDPLYANRGARMDDPQSARDGQVSQRANQTGYNDAGWDIWPTNYARFITQINPEAESIGLFRIGGDIDENSSIYSRFARSFEHSTGKNAMYFKMNDNFFSTAAGEVTFSIIYYDKNEGSTWELKYDAGNENFITATTVICTGSNTWKTEEVTVTDAVMLHNGPQGADFALINNDNKDDIFHMVEVGHLSDTNIINDNVSITSPASGEEFIINNPITVVAEGFDNQGIESIRFKVDDGAFFTDNTAPYSNEFTDLTEGEHTLLVQMLDNSGNTLNSEEVVINVSPVLSINEVDILGTNQFRVYPTVVIDVLNWELNDTVIQQIRVIGLDGREFLNEKVNDSNSIDLSKLKPGIYLVLFKIKDTGIVNRMIIKN